MDGLEWDAERLNELVIVGQWSGDYILRIFQQINLTKGRLRVAHRLTFRQIKGFLKMPLLNSQSK